MFARRAVVLGTLCGIGMMASSAVGTTTLAEPVTAQGFQPDSDAVEASGALFGGSLWKKAKYDVEGTYRIYETDGKRFVELGEGFRTHKGPDLKLVLSPLTTAKVKSKTALDGGYVVGLLKSEKGIQRFEIPTSLDLSRYHSLLVHCQKYTKLWGSVELNRGRVAAVGSAWVKKTNKAKGRFEIIEYDGRLILRVGEGFSTKKGPDLKWVLSPNSTRNADGKNALRGGLKLGSLKSNKGAQQFVLAEGTDLSAFRTLLVHCEKYSKLWAAADLRIIKE